MMVSTLRRNRLAFGSLLDRDICRFLCMVRLFIVTRLAAGAYPAALTHASWTLVSWALVSDLSFLTRARCIPLPLLPHGSRPDYHDMRNDEGDLITGIIQQAHLVFIGDFYWSCMVPLRNALCQPWHLKNWDLSECRRWHTPRVS